MTFRLVFIILILSPLSVFAQIDVGVRLISLTAHPLAKNDLPLHKNNIDNDAYFTLEPGISADINFPLYYRLRYGIELQAISDRFSGFTASVGINIAWMLVKAKKHRVLIGIGPKVYFWQNRNYPNNYKPDEKYKTDISPSRKLMPVTAYAEYIYEVNKKIRISAGISQCHPKSLGFTMGLHFILPGFGGKGCNCPGYR